MSIKPSLLGQRSLSDPLVGPDPRMEVIFRRALNDETREGLIWVTHGYTLTFSAIGVPEYVALCMGLTKRDL